MCNCERISPLSSLFHNSWFYTSVSDPALPAIESNCLVFSHVESALFWAGVIWFSLFFVVFFPWSQLLEVLSHNNNSFVMCAEQSHLLWLSQSCWPCSWDCFTDWWWVRSCQCLPYTSELSASLCIPAALSSPHPSGGLSRWIDLGWTSGAHKASLSLLSWAGQGEKMQWKAHEVRKWQGVITHQLLSQAKQAWLGENIIYYQSNQSGIMRNKN